MNRTFPDQSLARNIFLTTLLCCWLVHSGLNLKTSYHRPNTEPQLYLSQRLALAALYSDGVFELAKPVFLRLALAIESDPGRRSILLGQGGQLNPSREMPFGYRQAADYQREPKPERLLELKILAFQGLYRLGLCVLLSLAWLTAAIALISGADVAPAAKSTPKVSVQVGLGVFFLWALLVPYALVPLVRMLSSTLDGWSLLWTIHTLNATLLLGLLKVASPPHWRPLDRPVSRRVGQGLLLCGVAILSIEITIFALTGISPFARNPTLTLALDAHGLSLLGFIVYAVVVGPFLEELLFRGWILPALLTRLGQRDAVILSAALFALSHGNCWNLPGQFAGGIILGWLALRTGSITTTALVHGGWNAFWLIRVLANAP